MFGVSKTKYVIMVEYFDGNIETYTVTSDNPKRYEHFIEFVKIWSDVAFIQSYTIDSTGEQSETQTVWRAF